MGQGAGVLSEKLSGGMDPVSHNPYPIYYQTCWFFPTYLWPDKEYNPQYMTVDAGKVALNIECEKLYLFMVLLTLMKK